MRIAITAFFRGSAFSAALPQVAVNLSRVLVGLGHTVEFVLPSDSEEWFIDCKELRLSCPTVRLQNGMSLKKYNLLIEVVWYLPAELRVQVADKTVMFYHYPPVFYDIESSVYPINTPTRNFQNIDALWTWSHHKRTDIEYLELLSRRPVFTLPFLWDPVFCSTYMKEAGITGRAQGDPEIVICESNESNTSNCTLPMTVLSEIYRGSTELKPRWTVLNGEQLLKQDFFVNNILKNLHIYGTEEKPVADISGNFGRRVRLPDLLGRPSVVLSHQRWRPMKYMLLDALWMGLPLIHNCEQLRGIAGGAFYPLNQIKPALEGWEAVVAGKIGVANREDLLKWWGPAVATAAFPELLEKTFSFKKPVAVALRIAFFDMWVDFQPAHNLIVSALTAAGVAFELNQKNPNLIVFGPFGTENKRAMWNSVKKVFFTGECLGPVKRDDVVLNIGFNVSADRDYYRLPIWMTELNWYNEDALLVKNPTPLPLGMLERKADLTGRNKFCIFVASNPGSTQRNTVFQTLSRYKKVDSSGRLFTNSDLVDGGMGGAGGQLKKIDLYEGYKFAIVCENRRSPGYVTEKLVHAKLAGCVPIYWGDPLVHEEFNSGAFINVSDFKTIEGFLNKIKMIDEDDNLWYEIAGRPLITDMCKFTGRLSQLSRVLLAASAASADEDTGVVSHDAFTRFLQGPVVTAGAATTAATTTVTATASTAATVAASVDQGPIANDSQQVIVTCCNSNFVPSAIKLVASSSVPIYVWTIGVTEEEKGQLQRAGAKQVFSFNTQWVPADFDDFWNMSHYTWKPLLLNLANQCFKADTSVLYLDAGIEITGTLDPVWRLVEKDDIFVCQIKEQKMRTWSHPAFCSLLKLTEAELNEPQYSANIVGLKAGGRFSSVFSEAFELAKKREIISGQKWFQYSKECFGHRHDQSILSLLGFRGGVVGHNIAEFADSTSHMYCVRQGFAFYAHRGLWKYVVPLAENIDEAFLVNLDHREDRLQKFYDGHPYLKGQINRVSAVYGNKLVLNPEVVHLFRNNDFNWKKGVIGCALSHYNIWRELVANQMRKSILVLEDDAVLVPQFMAKWRNVANSMPEDTDVVFLGGVLPPNKPALPMVTEPVNGGFAKVRKHNIGGVMRRYFHFCTYSYIITNKGAQKLLRLIEERGIFTSIDHMMVNHGDGLLNIYFTTPLLAGCFQDDDPKYVHADFNDFNRVDKFDSEIWNNNECFSREEVSATASAGSSPALFVYFEEGQQNCIESDWLTEIFGPIEWIHANKVESKSTFILYYQHTTPVSQIMGWVNRHMDSTLFLYHASDETCTTDISLYTHVGIKTVFRTYWRPECVSSKVVHLPLGYLNKKGGGAGSDRPVLDRQYVWSFAGAMDRPNRAIVLETLMELGLSHRLHRTPTWNSPENLGTDEYVTLLQDTKIIPCLHGFRNVECYRFYEALEHGCIPVVPIDDLNSYANVLNGSANPPLLGVREIRMLPDVIKTIGQNNAILEQLQKDTRNWWVGYKMYLRKLVSARLSVCS